MLLEKLARAIACKHCENPSKLYELQIHADEQTREILRLNHVLDEIKKEREEALASTETWMSRCERREEELDMANKMLDRITKTNCSNCGNGIACSGRKAMSCATTATYGRKKNRKV
jgi:hypothetical protein